MDNNKDMATIKYVFLSKRMQCSNIYHFFTGSTTNELPAGPRTCAEKERRRQRLSGCLSRSIVLLLRC
jgi:hypothetical protein